MLVSRVGGKERWRRVRSSAECVRALHFWATVVKYRVFGFFCRAACILHYVLHVRGREGRPATVTLAAILLPQNQCAVLLALHYTTPHSPLRHTLPYPTIPHNTSALYLWRPLLPLLSSPLQPSLPHITPNSCRIYQYDF